jgi:hypothetical protein
VFFEIQHLDWASLLQVPWLITHEFICHVQQIPGAGGAARPRCAPGCVFYEGWMDEVARRLLQTDLVARAVKPHTGFIFKHRLTIDDAATKYRAWRYGDAPGANPPKYAAQWKIGMNAARSLLQLFELACPPDTALRNLVGLSFRIQRAHPTAAQLEQLAWLCQLVSERAMAGDRAIRGRALSVLTGKIVNIAKWINELRRI